MAEKCIARVRLDNNANLYAFIVDNELTFSVGLVDETRHVDILASEAQTLMRMMDSPSRLAIE